MLLLLSYWVLVLFLLLILWLILSLSLVRCCCAFSSFCHFSFKTIIFLSLFVALSSSSILLPLSVMNLLLSNFNSSLTLEFDDSLFLFSEADSTMNLTTRIFLLSSWFFHVEILSLFEFPNGSLVKFVNWNLSVSLLRSQTSPHVMYSSALWFLGLSMGIGLCIW